MARIVIEIEKEKDIWYPVYPTEKRHIQFTSKEAAEWFVSHGRWKNPTRVREIG